VGLEEHAFTVAVVSFQPGTITSHPSLNYTKLCRLVTNANYPR